MKTEKLQTKRIGLKHVASRKIWANDTDAVRDVADSSRARNETIALVN